MNVLKGIFAIDRLGRLEAGWVEGSGHTGNRRRSRLDLAILAPQLNINVAGHVQRRQGKYINLRLGVDVRHAHDLARGVGQDGIGLIEHEDGEDNINGRAEG